ncbi:MAG: hypothetical protein GXY44_04665 [Phycisphaerales bacterium]|nr:hypothetical protein [Phycisphaerales bacterium]
MKRSLPSVIAGGLLVIILGWYMISFQVRYNQCALVRTFGRIQPPGLLFSIMDDGQSMELDEGTLPSKLREAFRQNQVDISNEITVRVVLPGEHWEFDDQGRPYSVQVADNILAISDPRRRESRDVIKQPGLYWKWPWPIQQVTTYDNRIQIYSLPGEELPTQDGKNVILTTTVEWRIDDPYLFSVRCGDMQTASINLRTQVRDYQKTVMGQYEFANLVSVNPEELKYDEIESKIQEAIQPVVRKLYGIEAVSVNIEKLALPAQITQTVFEAMKKERQALAAGYTSQGKSEAKKITDEAEAIASTIMSFAERKASEIRAEGLRRAAQYNQVLSEDEALAEFLLKIQYLPEILKKRTTILWELVSPFDILRESSSNASPSGANAPPDPSVLDVK